MIILLGATGYVGQAFQELLRMRGLEFLAVSRSDFDYYDSAILSCALLRHQASFLINAAGYTGKPNVDACEDHKGECLLGNTVLPAKIREACERTGVPWGHVSSGCIYSGRRSDGRGYLEEDFPNFSFRANHCSFYSGTKALGEEVLQGASACFIWRLRIPFDHRNSRRNYLSKVQNYARLLDAENSISHLGDFTASCLACWERKIPYGTYNLTNPGTITTRLVVDLIRQHLTPQRDFDFFADEDEFMRLAAKAFRSNCVMDTSKIEAAGLPMRPVTQALEDSLRRWQHSP